MNNGEQFFNTSGGGYEIERSLRFNSADTAYLSRTPASAGNRKTWTWAGWVKRTAPDTGNYLFMCQPDASNYSEIYFDTDNRLKVSNRVGGTDVTQRFTTAVYRDVSAWYHVVVASDSSSFLKVYVNGVEVTAFSTSIGPTTADWSFNSASTHAIGANSGASGYFLNGCLADCYLIDGQALDPTSFGEFDTNGVWQPIDASGLTYGTNGFHLPFSDNSTAAALGTDTSGNGNDWTVNNISVIQGNGNYLKGTITGSPFDASYTWSNAFDGSLAGLGAQSNGGLTYTLTFSTALTGTDFYIYTDQAGNNTNNAFAFNGITATTLNTTQQAGGGPYYKYKLDGISTLASVTTSTVANFLGIEIDGVLLIDNSYSAGNDSLVDSPTNYGEDTGAGGEVRGNYATLNPIEKQSIYAGSYTLSEGNLKSVQNSGYANHPSTIAMKSGKWYCEGRVDSLADASNQMYCGIIRTDASVSAYGYFQTLTPDLGSMFWGDDTGINRTFAYGASYASIGTILGIAFDADLGSCTYYINGVSQGATTYSIVQGKEYYFGFGSYTSGGWSVNFGQRPFAYTAPSGFKALCTTNLAEPTIADGSTAMDVALYTGNGSTQTISGLNFSPDLIWFKSRSNALSHTLTDSVRGRLAYLMSDSTVSEGLATDGYHVNSFNSDGFTLGLPWINGVNSSGMTNVAWTWDAGSSTVTNNDGSIESQVRANPGAGFSVVTFTGAGSSGTVGHGLGVTPEFMIVKTRNATDGWTVYHKSLGASQAMGLQSTSAAYTSSVWNTSPTSSIAYIAGGYISSGITNVMYCFAPVAGYSSFGSYTGNGSADGPFVFTGMRPKFLLFKSAGAGDWVIIDATRDTYNVSGYNLYPNDSIGENFNARLDILSNGFKLRSTFTSTNPSGTSVVYAAFAEHPFATSRAR